MLITNAVTRKWTREEYSRISESGIFGFDERVELIEGEVVAKQNKAEWRGLEYGEKFRQAVDIFTVNLDELEPRVRVVGVDGAVSGLDQR